MKEQIEILRTDLKENLKNCQDIKAWNELYIQYLGKKGSISFLMNEMKNLSNEEKKVVGEQINGFKKEITDTLDSLKKELEEQELNIKLQKEQIDLTLPSMHIPSGRPHILERLIEELETFFMEMGYTVEEGPEVEKDLYNFELLNLPKGHPARDAQDTFYIQDEEILLRSHTSPVQIRTMLKNEEKTPLRIICPGKTYRRDDDATHTHQFTQVEGLLIDHNISMADVKGTFDLLAKKLYGKDQKTRFRSSFYPFTEPSVELDVSCFNCLGKGCHICKKTGWITVGGAGMVHPNVLRNGGYDPEEYTGFAFGFGIERLAMLKYGITDARTLYTNDLRGISPFDQKRGDE